jgi:adenylyl-sulfate kinase
VINVNQLTIWFSGLSGAGKTTLAHALEHRLNAHGKKCIVLDGDQIRSGLNSDLGFSASDRSENIRRVAELAKLINDSGFMVISSLISPFEADRYMARQIIGAARFKEVYINTPLDVCESRDVKGLYKRARRGEIHGFTGVTSPFEPPRQADLVLDTSCMDVDCCVDLIFFQACS